MITYFYHHHHHHYHFYLFFLSVSILFVCLFSILYLWASLISIPDPGVLIPTIVTLVILVLKFHHWDTSVREWDNQWRANLGKFAVFYNTDLPHQSRPKINWSDFRTEEVCLRSSDTSMNSVIAKNQQWITKCYPKLSFIQINNTYPFFHRDVFIRKANGVCIKGY